MTPDELANLIHKELSPTAPRLSAAINRALLDIGEGSSLVGLGPGKNKNEDVSFTESETIRLGDKGPAAMLAHITQITWQLEEHSAWKVFIDRKKSENPNLLELYYTLFRMKV
jgi:hypothetical protein